MIQIRVIDFETTGLPSSDPNEPSHRIVEAGWTDVELFPETEKAFVRYPTSRLVHPGRSIPPEASAVHHITEEDLPPFAEGALERLLRDLFDPGDFSGREILAAHNMRFERAFFDPEGARWIDTYRCAVRAWPEAPAHNNWALAYWLGIKFRGNLDAWPPHRAGPDSFITAQILARIFEDGHNVDELLAWTAEPILLPRVLFGKHAGKAWEEVPPDYLGWILHSSIDDPDVLFTARYWLDRAGRHWT